MNGKKYISKAHEEEFDEEKGLLMCLAKANGISHLELQRMIKGAKRVSMAEKISKKIKKASKDEVLKIGGIVKKETIDCISRSIHDEMLGNVELKKHIDSEISKALKKQGRPRRIKVGDKVRIKEVPHNDYEYGYEPEMEELKGNVYQIAEVRDNNTFIVYHNDYDYWYARDEIELVEE